MQKQNSSIFIVGSLLTTIAVGSTGCLRVSDSHCTFSGGDFGCEDDRWCIGAVGDSSDDLPETDTNGCLLPNEEELSPRLIHVKYGLFKDKGIGEDDANPSILDTKRLDIASNIVYEVIQEEHPDSLFSWSSVCRNAIGDLDSLDQLVEIYSRRQSADRKISMKGYGFSQDEKTAIESFSADLDKKTESTDSEIIYSCLINGQPSDTESDDTSEGEGSSSEGTETSGGSDAMATTTTGPECESSEQCKSRDSERPICLAGSCVPCGEGGASCADVFPSTPACHEGACVECTSDDAEMCSGPTPICDNDESLCVGCSSHEQCVQAGCNLFTGECLPNAGTVEVHPDFHDLQDSIDSIEGGEGTIIVHDADADEFDETITIRNGQTIALLVQGGPSTLWNTDFDNPNIIVEPGGVLLADGVGISGNDQDDGGVLVSGGRAWIDRSQIVLNDRGVRVEAGGALVVRNSFIGAFGHDDVAIDVDGSTATILYTTAINSGHGTSPGSALRCTDSSIVNSTDSIFLDDGNGAPIACTPQLGTITHCITNEAGSNNDCAAVAFDEGSTFFVDVDNGDFSLTPFGGISFHGSAVWNSGDPLTDIFGTSRPNIVGVPDYPGAHVP